MGVNGALYVNGYDNGLCAELTASLKLLVDLIRTPADLYLLITGVAS